LKIIGIVSVVVVIGIVALLFILSGIKGGPELKDCGTDFTCIINASANCTPAKGTLNLYEMSGSGPAIYFEVRSGNMQACNYYMRINDVVQSTVGSADELLAAEKGKEIACTAPASMLVYLSMYTDINLINSSACSGSLKDLLNSFMNQGPITGKPVTIEYTQQKFAVVRCYSGTDALDLRSETGIKLTDLKFSVISADTGESVCTDGYNIASIEPGETQRVVPSTACPLEAGAHYTLRSNQGIPDVDFSCE
jgi:hypothetical protein